MMEPKGPSEKIKVALKQKSDMYKRVFVDDPEGVKVLKGLRHMFDPPNIFDRDAGVAAFKLGQRDVVKYIDSLVNYISKENK